jgi:hypothetical protein
MKKSSPKILVRTGQILFVLLAGMFSIGFFLPSKASMERSVIINAPIEEVYGSINEINRWEEWSPWMRMDPSIRIDYFGNPAGPGAGFRWISSNPNLKTGSIMLTHCQPNDSIMFVMDYMLKRKIIGYFYLVPENDQVKVTWKLDIDLGKNPVRKFFGRFADKAFGPDFNKGLQFLKEHCERRKDDSPKSV